VTPGGATETPRASREELRTAAAELARGAVGVARGVWDGVVERVSSSPRTAGDGTPAPGASPAGSAGGAESGADSEVLVVHSLEDPDEASLEPAPGALSSPDAPWRVELRRAREREPGAALAAAGANGAPLATVPVPPRAEGGFLGSVVQSLVVGAEIMGALITGPVMVFARGTAQVFDRIVRGVPAVLGVGIRLVLFLLLMGLIGAVCAFVLLAALALNP
jgi:hypothetical protein